MSEFTSPGGDATISDVTTAVSKLPKVISSTTAPTNPKPGDVWIDTNAYVPALAPTVSATAPTNPQVGDLWVDTSPSVRITVGQTAPTSPAINDIWIDTK